MFQLALLRVARNGAKVNFAHPQKLCSSSVNFNKHKEEHSKEMIYVTGCNI